MSKGSRRRVRQISREEEDLRWALHTRVISHTTFRRRYNKLKKQGKIIRSGKVVR